MDIVERVRKFLRHKPDPNLGIARGKCPFYGFTFAAIPGKTAGIMMDTGGNGCPLEGNLAHSPCKMEMLGLEPNWAECFRYFPNSESEGKALDDILDKVTIAPKEHWPEEVSSWAGVPLRDWFTVITERAREGNQPN